MAKELSLSQMLDNVEISRFVMSRIASLGEVEVDYSESYIINGVSVIIEVVSEDKINVTLSREEDV